MRDQLLGAVLSGRYRVDAVVARGGMAMVYRGVDLQRDRPVAIKVMHSHLAADDSFVARFQREAANAGRLSHPNLIAVWDQDRDGDVVYLVMEYLESVTLRRELRERGRLSPRQAIVVTDAILAALQAVHAAGMIHRDLKPDNILLGAHGQIKLTDFGLSRAVTTETTTKTLIGTVGYVAPELVTRTGADARTDLYTVGIMLYEMLTGSQPYTDEVPIQVAYRHVHDRVPAPSVLVAGLAPQLDRLVLALTQVDPAERPAGADEVRALLGDVRAELSDAQLDLGAQPGRLGKVLTAEPATPAPDAADGPEGRASTREPEGNADGEAAKGAAGATPHAAAGTTGVGAAAADSNAAGSAGTDPSRAGSVAAGPDARGVGAATTGASRTTTGSTTKASAASASGSAKRNTTQPIYIRRRRGLLAIVAAAFVLVLGGWAAIASVRHEGTTVAQQPTTQADIKVPVIAAGGTPEAAKQTLESAGFTTVANSAFHAKIASGAVIGTRPAAGALVPPGSQIVIVVSKGREQAKVPDLESVTRASAKSRLSGVGLKLGKVTRKYSDSVDSGRIISQSEKAGTRIDKGSTVDVIVSKGERPLTIPDVKGMSYKAAMGKLTRMGFRVGKDEVYSKTVKKGNVVSTYPNAGKARDRDSLILLRVSKGKEPAKKSATDTKKKGDAKKKDSSAKG